MTKAAHKDAESDDTLDDEPEDLYQPGEEDFDPNEDNLLAELHLATSGSNTPGVCTNLVRWTFVSYFVESLKVIQERAPGEYTGGDRRGERTCDEWQL
ncbi:uncharacterized protein LOC135337661 isoform X3 [Halichondria panicea]|uniref:uncharacterized protein LOC135337661 isoform X3 n=1 Tax=Halichondria panicea TaxID=6063 RepID=UPI00312B9899